MLSEVLAPTSGTAPGQDATPSALLLPPAWQTAAPMSPLAMIGASVTMVEGHLRGASIHRPMCRDTGCCAARRFAAAGTAACPTPTNSSSGSRIIVSTGTATAISNCSWHWQLPALAVVICVRCSAERRGWPAAGTTGTVAGDVDQLLAPVAVAARPWSVALVASTREANKPESH